MTAPAPRTGSFGAGLLVALVSAATFGTSGTFGKALIGLGWSPSAIVTVRVGLGALLLLGPGLLALRGRWHLLRRNAGDVLAYGLVAVALCQLAYFNAVGRLSVGVALMLEYLGPILVVAWIWARTGRRPGRLTMAGMVISVVGLVLVLDAFSGLRLDAIGVLWGLVAAVALAGFFVIAGRDHEDNIPPITLAAGGLLVGTVALAVLGLVGVLPWRTATGSVAVAGTTLPWWAAILELGVVAAAIAYVTGIDAARRLGSRVSSFVGLTEVLFAVLFAWWLLGEVPRPIQLLGGLAILAGVVAVRLDERDDAHPELDAGDVPGPDVVRKTREHPAAPVVG